MSTNNNQATPSNGNPLDQAVSPLPNDTPVISLDGTQFVVPMNLVSDIHTFIARHLH
jgi:hypothetical protein